VASRWAARPRVNAPAVSSLVAFISPAVQDAQLRHSVERGFLPGGAAGFKRRSWSVEPDVDAAHQVLADVNVVIFDEGDPSAEPMLSSQVVNFADQAAPRGVRRVGLASEYELHGAPFVVEDLLQALDVTEDQHRAFIGRKTARKAYGERVGVEHRPSG